MTITAHHMPKGADVWVCGICQAMIGEADGA